MKHKKGEAVILGELAPPFCKNFNKGDAAVITYVHDDHYTIEAAGDKWWVDDNEIDEAKTAELRS